VALDLGEKFQGGFGACGVALGLQAHAHAHDAVEGQGQSGANPSRSVEDGEATAIKKG
jgi:hypothetical protein